MKGQDLWGRPAAAPRRRPRLKLRAERGRVLAAEALHEAARHQLDERCRNILPTEARQLLRQGAEIKPELALVVPTAFERGPFGLSGFSAWARRRVAQLEGALATPTVAVLSAIALAGGRRAHARRWMPGTQAQPGITFIYGAGIWPANHANAEREVTRRELLRRQHEIAGFDRAA